MFIEDEELRVLYRDASQDHLDNLEAGLLHLEKHPSDAAKLTELLRATHSLKGDSRMLGVEDAETITHQIEDLLIAVEQGGRSLTPALCDCLYQGLDAVRKIAHAAVTGDPADVSVFHVLAQLMNAGDGSEGVPADVPPSELTEPSDSSEEVDLKSDWAKAVAELEADFPVLEEGQGRSDGFRPANGHSPPPMKLTQEAIPAEETSLTAADASAAVSIEEGDAYHIDTVRVASAKLDALVTQAGELAVTKGRIGRRTDDIDKVLSLWETWSSEALVNRLALSQLQRQLDPDSLAPIQKLLQLNDGHLDQLGELLKQMHTSSYEDAARLESISNTLESGILQLRQLPLSSLFNLFPRMVRDLAKAQDKEINLVIEGGDTQADKRILEEMKAPLTHLLRNAIDHGIETARERLVAGKSATATIRLRAYQSGSRIGLEVIDDGRGLNLESIQRTALRRGLHTEAELAKMTQTQLQDLIFAPGFSTRTTVTEISGRGVGLDVVRANVERLKGSIQVESTPGQGCTFRFLLNTSLATTYALILAVQQRPFAIPVEFVDVMMRVEPDDIFTLEGSPTILFQGQPLSVAWLSDLLELPQPTAPESWDPGAALRSLSCVVLNVGSEQLGLFVDEFIDQQDIVLKPQSKLLKRVRNIAGATILGTGEVCMVLSPQDLLRTAQGQGAGVVVTERAMVSDRPKSIGQTSPTAIASDPAASRSPTTNPNVLLVEDSIPIRTQVRRILERAGYTVTAAVDGLDGFAKLQEGNFDAVVSDVEMPNLDGLGLTARIRQQAEYEDLPIILVTTLAKDEDKRRGADAGANAYITKGDFDQSLLINTLRRLI
jgi:two-component system chemotaxis sensor kinase CheA